MADGEPVRFTDLLHTIEGISQKMLTKNLRALERDGVVIRTVYPSAPVRIEYRLSDLGMSLLEPLAALRQWGDRLSRRCRVGTEGPRCQRRRCSGAPVMTKLPPAEQSPVTRNDR
jgi:DNA-binding HxlR family transcriptional regulator